MNIHFHELGVRANLLRKRNLKIFIIDLFAKEKTPFAKTDIIFCTDEYLLSLNNKHLNHDYFTDTMTFHYQDKNKPVIGEIYISIDRVKENAKSLKIPYQTELRRIIFHGILHLCGYSDKGKKSDLMINKQEFYLSQFNVSRETPKF